MQQRIENTYKSLTERTILTAEDAENFRIEFLSKNGIISGLFEDFKNVSGEEKRLYGKVLNDLKNKAQQQYNDAKEALEAAAGSAGEDAMDYTLPPVLHEPGTRHPVNLVMDEICEIFRRIGFNVSDGPEIESDYYNFTALNFAENHPAREMQDTFFLEKNPDMLLRTHTSSIQARVMESQEPPIRTLSPGRVYRNEAISARAHCYFHQIEGLYIHEKVSFADLKQTLLYFAREYFGKNTKIRLRPSYFPFTEPSAELDVTCFLCNGKGCNMCKYTGWVEIGGCGMVDPNVLKAGGIDPEKYSGFAFGMGIERIAILKYKVRDIRLFAENDVRFLKQFVAAN